MLSFSRVLGRPQPVRIELNSSSNDEDLYYNNNGGHGDHSFIVLGACLHILQ